MNHNPIALSVVIASLRPGPVILECLAALERQMRQGVEVIVVDGGADGTAEAIRERFPWVRLMEVEKGRSIPQLRGEGMAAATGGVVGILDAWCIPNDRWVEGAISAHGEYPELAVGGAVSLAESERTSFVAWATYLFDYWEFVEPFPDGHAGVLPGNDITFKRGALPDARTLRAHGFWKAFTNAELIAAGHRLRASRALAVQIKRRLPLLPFFRSRYHHGRSYAAMRIAGKPLQHRLKWASITPLLPLLFLWRQTRGLISKPGARAWFVITAPLQLAFHSSWAWGELCGYVSGPGRSHESIRS